MSCERKNLRESLNFDRVNFVPRESQLRLTYTYNVSDDFILRSGGIESGNFKGLSIAAQNDRHRRKFHRGNRLGRGSGYGCDKVKK